MFYSENNLRALFDDDISSYLGPACDELARHQPKLKLQIIESAYDALLQILKLQKLESNSQGIRPPEMELMTNNSTEDVKIVEKDTKVKVSDEIDCVLFFECIVRFFEGFFQHMPHCSYVLEKYPRFAETLLEIYDSDFLGFDFASSAVSYSLSHIFRTMSDDQPQDILRTVFAKLREYFKDGEYYLKTSEKESLILPYMDLKVGRKPEAMKLFASFKSIHALIGLLCDVYSSPIFSNSKGFYSMIKTFSEEGHDIIVGLMNTYRWCAVESVYVRFGVPEAWISKKESSERKPGTDKKHRKICDPNDPRIRNFKTWKYLLSQTTAFIVPLFQGLCKNMLPRRAESDQKLCATKLAVLMMDSLTSLLTYARVPSVDPKNFSVSIKKKFQFFHICSGLIHTFLTDERNTKSLLTIMAYAFFYKVLDVVLQDIIPDLLDTALEVINDLYISDEIRTDLLDRCHRTVEGFFNILGLIVDHKPLLESGHTSFLLSDSNNASDSANSTLPFELCGSSDYLIRIRLKILENVATWISIVDISGKEFKDATIVRLGGTSLTSLIHIIMVILQAKGESEIRTRHTFRKKSKLTAEPLVSENAAGSRISILQDMGFTEDQSRAALRSNNNSVMRAAEFLLSNPEYQPDADLNENNSRNDMEVVSDDGNEEYEDVEDENEMSVDTDVSDSDSPADEYVLKLDDVRQKTEDFFIRNLFMLSSIGDVVFDIKDLIVSIIRKAEPREKSLLRDRLNFRQIFGGLEMELDVSRVRDLASKFHLLALLVHENTVAGIVRSELNDFLGIMIESISRLVSTDIPGESRLLISILLILESIITSSTIVQKDVAMKSFCSDPQMSLIINSCLQILKSETLSKDKTLLHVVYQILLRLSRDSNVAKTIFESDGFDSLFCTINMLPLSSIEKSLSILILRHSIENDDILRLQTERSLVNQFSAPSKAVIDISAVLKNNASLCLRNTPSFYKTCLNLLKISKISPSRHHLLSLNDANEKKDPRDVFSRMESVFASSESALKLVTSAVEKIVISCEESSRTDNHFAICSNLYLLGDIFTVYPAARCVLLFLQGERFNIQSFFHTIISKLLPYDDLRLRDPSESENRRQVNVGAWTAQFLQIIANVNFVGMKESSSKEIDIDTSLNIQCNVVCQKMIQCLAECLKTAFQNAGIDRKKRLCVYQSVSDLLSKFLVTPSAFTRAETNASAEGVRFMAKVMFDEGLVSILSKISSSLEMDVKEMKTVGKSIIKTLELLTKTANTVVERKPVSAIKYKTLLGDIRKGAAHFGTVQSEGFINDSALGVFSRDNDTMETDSPDESDDEEDQIDDMSDMDHGEPGDFTDMSDEDVSAEESANSSASEDENDMDIVVRTVPLESDDNSNSEMSDNDGNMNESDMDSEHTGSDPDEWVVEIHANEHSEGSDDEEIDEEITANAHMQFPDDIYMDHEITDDEVEDDELGDEADDFDAQNEQNDDDQYYSESDEDEVVEYPNDFDRDSVDATGLPFGNMGEFLAPMRQSPARRIRRGNVPATIRAGHLFQDEQSVQGPAGPPMFLNELIESSNMGWVGTNSNQRSHALDVSNNPMLDRSQWATVNDSRSSQALLSNSAAGNDNDGQNITGQALQFLEQIFNINAQNMTMSYLSEGRSKASESLLKIGTELEIMRPSDRWSQEAIILFGTRYSEKSATLDSDIIDALTPAFEAEQKQSTSNIPKPESPVLEGNHVPTDAVIEAPTAQMIDQVERENNTVENNEAGTTSQSQAIVINGARIDLSNLGIDRTFIEALPDDLRAEVLVQHLREQGDLTMHTAFPGEINGEFLEALPVDLREEILNLREVESQGMNVGHTGENSSTAVSDFMAIFEQNIQRVMRNVAANSRVSGDVETDPRLLNTVIGEKPEEKEESYEPKELLDINDLYVLMHMIVANDQVRKSAPIFEVMLNLAENSKTRTEILETVLYIIQEVIQMERIKSLSETNTKVKQKLSSSGTMTPKRNLVRQAVMGEKVLLNEGSQASVIQRCLELLLDLLSRKGTVAMFFLTESETLHVKTYTKHKKNRSRPQSSRYPLVLLLSFLESPIFSKNNSLMENLTQIISLVTKPLAK